MELCCDASGFAEDPTRFTSFGISTNAFTLVLSETLFLFLNAYKCIFSADIFELPKENKNGSLKVSFFSLLLKDFFYKNKQ